MATYSYLFRPLEIGPMTIKNRVIFGPHVTGHWSGEFLPTARAKAYYEERARGGVGMIIVGAASVDETADYYPFTQHALYKDEVIPGLREIADAVHAFGTKIVQQIVHPGVHQIPERDSLHPARAPSQIPAIEEPFYIPKELEIEEIVEIEDKFARAAQRVKRAGFDGVEVHVAHGYLLWAFLTPLKNKRSDEYGGTFDKRFRFVREALDKVRAAVGRDFVVGVRVISSDMYPGGLDVDECVRIAKTIEQTGNVDYISVSTGLYRSLGVMIPSHYAGFEPGYQGEFTRKIKSELTRPVFQVGKINDAALADHIIASGAADAVIMVRELIAEPHFVKKVEEGRAESARPCIYCNQKCLAHIFIPGGHVECNVNPTAGEEFRWAAASPGKAAARKKVLVVGAGPGGLECARTAAERGHDVVIYERDAQIGGQMRFLRALPGRSEPGNILDWLEREVRRLDVPVKLSRPVTEETIDAILAAEKPDAVVVAAGARPARDGRSGLTTEPIPGWQGPNVFTYEDVLNGAATKLGKRLLIVDELGDRTAPGLAEKFAEGRQVTILTRWPNVFHMWGLYWNETAFVYGRLDELGVRVVPSSWVKEIRPGAATCFNVFSSREWEEAADSVILITMKYSNMETYKLLKSKGVKAAYLVGDAKSPRHIGDAIRDGYAAALEI
ncbi:MAG: FAD-dependent oxidoreductase [Deltaproteobacteria bacterium]|nr:FAD-dependent oxidoreductase [Deltaproteobacteria bacterium]